MKAFFIELFWIAMGLLGLAGIIWRVNEGHKVWTRVFKWARSRYKSN